MLTPTDFLKELVTNKAEYVLAEEDKKTIAHEGLATFVFNKLNSTKYRAQSTTPEYLQKIKDKIALCLNHQMPITLSLPFGATKNPYIPTAPGIDWAEVFTMVLMREYLAPIAAAYDKGVVLKYISVAVFEEQTNYITQKDLALYDKEFEQTLTEFKKYLPKNMQFEYVRVGDEIPKAQIDRLLELKVAELRKDWNKQTQEKIDYKLFRAKRNCIHDPEAKNVDQVILKSALVHDAFCSGCWTTDLAPWDKKYMITLGHTYTTGWAIHVRSAPGSTINFWSGIGVLEKRGERYLPVVLSLTQYQAVQERLLKVPTVIFNASLTPLKEVLYLES